MGMEQSAEGAENLQVVVIECFAASHAAVRDRMYSRYSWLVFISGMV